MTGRREFLRLLGLAGAWLGVPAVGAPFAEQEPAALPEPIRALESLRGLARPITLEERQQRLERARALMRAQRLDAVLMTGGTSLEYFTGIRWGLSERLFAVVLPVRGAAFVVCPAFELDRAQEQLAASPLGAQADVRLWQEDESPYVRVVEGLRDRGFRTGRLGIEETVRFVFFDGLRQAASGWVYASATPVTAGCRMIKSAHEIELMRLASRVTLTAYRAVWRALEPGMTQHQVEALVAAAHQRLGFPGGASVQVGPYSALPHGSATPQVIREGEVIMMDGGCRVEGYCSDITRTFVLGRAPDRVRKVFDIVLRAQTAARQAARAGLEAQAVDRAARAVIEAAGYGPGYRYFTHRLGHGIGMDGHEWPYLVRGNRLALQPQMTFSDEPGIYIRGEFGVRLEDELHILEDGAELFTPQSPSPEQPFGAD